MAISLGVYHIFRHTHLDHGKPTIEFHDFPLIFPARNLRCGLQSLGMLINATMIAGSFRHCIMPYLIYNFNIIYKYININIYIYILISYLLLVDVGCISHYNLFYLQITRYVPYCLHNGTYPIAIISPSPWSVTLPSPCLRAGTPGSMASQGGRPRARAIASMEPWRARCASGRCFDTHTDIYIYILYIYNYNYIHITTYLYI